MTRTKRPLGIVTMVYRDYFFLERWYKYYAAQVPPEDLFIFSHGNDPEHHRIAPGANIINVPRSETMFKFDLRRWRMMSQFASGMLEFYDWMIVADVDEIMIVDPLAAPDIVTYIDATYTGKPEGPKNIAPFALELMHVPDEEPLPLAPDATILSRRRIFRPSRVYSKPCLIGAPAIFGPGGHRNNLGLRHLSPDLYLLHLRFCDVDLMTQNAKLRKEIVEQSRVVGDENAAPHPWESLIENYLDGVSSYERGGEDVVVKKFRRAMLRQTEKHPGQFIWGPAKNATLYRIPERFAGVF